MTKTLSKTALLAAATVTLAGCASVNNQRVTQGSTAPILQELQQPAGWGAYAPAEGSGTRGGVALPDETALPVRAESPGSGAPKSAAISLAVPAEPLSDTAGPVAASAEPVGDTAGAGDEVAMPVRKGN